VVCLRLYVYVCSHNQKQKVIVTFLNENHNNDTTLKVQCELSRIKTLEVSGNSLLLDNGIVGFLF